MQKHKKKCVHVCMPSYLTVPLVNTVLSCCMKYSGREATDRQAPRVTLHFHKDAKQIGFQFKKHRRTILKATMVYVSSLYLLDV